VAAEESKRRCTAVVVEEFGTEARAVATQDLKPRSWAVVVEEVEEEAVCR